MTQFRRDIKSLQVMGIKVTTSQSQFGICQELDTLKHSQVCLSDSFRFFSSLRSFFLNKGFLGSLVMQKEGNQMILQNPADATVTKGWLTDNGEFLEISYEM